MPLNRRMSLSVSTWWSLRLRASRKDSACPSLCGYMVSGHVDSGLRTPGTFASVVLFLLTRRVGGSQVMTFGSMAGRVCDPHRVVADAVNMGKPIIVVALNYRLNIFGFGNGDTTNLALKDQALAVEWVRKHIAGFGGDSVS